MPSTRPRGFTLIELMLALGLLALLLLLGMPSFTAFVHNSQVRSTAESLVNGLRAAVAEATNRNRPVTFTLAGGGSADWRITWTDDNDQVQLIQKFSQTETASSTTVAVTPGNQLSVTFSELGRVQSAGTDNHIRQIDIASVAGDARTLRIIVDDPAPPDPAKPRGLRMCDPDPALAALSPPDPRAC